MSRRGAPVLVDGRLRLVFSVAGLTHDNMFRLYVLQYGAFGLSPVWTTAKNESRTWSRAAVSLKTLRHVVHSGCRFLVCRACSRSVSALENDRFQVGSGQREAGQTRVDDSPLFRADTDAMDSL